MTVILRSVPPYTSGIPMRLPGLCLFLLLLFGVMISGFLVWHVPPWLVTRLWIAPVYTPVIPVMLGFAAWLGPLSGFGLALAYLLLGLAIWPIFADGGGLGYWQTPGFSYLIGFIPACWWSARLLKNALLHRNPLHRIGLLCVAGVLSVLLVHLVGSLGLCLLSWLGWLSVSALPGRLITMTLLPLPLDMLFTGCLISLAVMVRRMYSYLT